MGRPALTPLQRFWPKVAVDPHGCWQWTGKKDTHGYGVLLRSPLLPKQTLAHRFSWEIHNGPIPDRLCVCHRCDNPLCVRPDHLFLGSIADNNKDMWMKKRGRHRVFTGSGHPRAKLTEHDVREIR